MEEIEVPETKIVRHNAKYYANLATIKLESFIDEIYTYIKFLSENGYRKFTIDDYCIVRNDQESRIVYMFQHFFNNLSVHDTYYIINELSKNGFKAQNTRSGKEQYLIIEW